MTHPQVKSIEEAEVHMASLYTRVANLERTVARLDKEMDMAFRTPYWKRMVYWADGWPLHKVIAQKDQPSRPWRKRWRS